MVATSPIRVLVLAMLASACGRISFDLGGPEDGTRTDASIDAPPMVTTTGPDSAALADCHMTHPSASFCDGFEGPMLEAWGYTVVENATVDATTARAYRGTRSLETVTANVDEYKYARWGRWVEEPIASGDLYYRAFYWLSSGTTIDEQASIVSFGYGVDPYPSTFILLVPGEIHLNTDQGSYSFAGDIPRDRWVCVEMHIAISQTAGQVSLTIDGGTPLVTGPIDTLVGDFLRRTS